MERTHASCFGKSSINLLMFTNRFSLQMRFFAFLIFKLLGNFGMNYSDKIYTFVWPLKRFYLWGIFFARCIMIVFSVLRSLKVGVAQLIEVLMKHIRTMLRHSLSKSSLKRTLTYPPTHFMSPSTYSKLFLSQFYKTHDIKHVILFKI